MVSSTGPGWGLHFLNLASAGGWCKSDGHPGTVMMPYPPSPAPPKQTELEISVRECSQGPHLWQGWEGSRIWQREMVISDTISSENLANLQRQGWPFRVVPSWEWGIQVQIQFIASHWAVVSADSPGGWGEFGQMPSVAEAIPLGSWWVRLPAGTVLETCMIITSYSSWKFTMCIVMS